MNVPDIFAQIKPRLHLWNYFFSNISVATSHHQPYRFWTNFASHIFCYFSRGCNICQSSDGFGF